VWKSYLNSIQSKRHLCIRVCSCVFIYTYKGWSKSHTTYIKIFTDGCKSIQFDWINKHTILLWLYKSPHRSRHVVTCSRQSVSLLTVQVQSMFIVKHYLASCSYFIFQNEFWDTSSDSPVPRIKTKYWAEYFKCHCRNSSLGCIKHEEKSECMHR
jgi:hypothetical protein